ncbi:lipopolysaccharide biosynthesis protein [Microbacterium sp. NPDC090007]|uniref:lipopolysaccharide biosynthesis protein n=1 Tax=Microbacterium sp. NPDC090007 TaxID=3364204 RepID=UPI0037F9D523
MRWTSVGSAAIAKAATLPINALVSLFAMQLVIGWWGVEAYASYGLLVALVALLPFADLGMAAVIINVVSQHGARSRNLRRALLSVLRILAASAVVLVSAAIVVTLLGSWRLLLGDSLLAGREGDLAVLLCVSLFAINLPVSIGARALVGLGQNTALILIQSLQYPLILAMILLMSAAGASAGPFLPVGAYISTFVVNALCVWLASRKLGEDFRWALRRLLVRRAKGARVGHTAWPMLVQSLAIPLATQSDRVVISQVSTTEQLAQYNLSSQIFMMVWQVTAAAGVSLWPIFSRMKDRGEAPPVGKASAIFAVVAAGCAGVLVCALPLIEDFVAHGLITLSPVLIGSFFLYVVMNAVLYPFGMNFMDPRGLKFQAWCVSLALPVNVTLSVILAREIGASGPIISSAVCMFVFQVVPYSIRFHKGKSRSKND